MNQNKKHLLLLFFAAMLVVVPAVTTRACSPRNAETICIIAKTFENSQFDIIKTSLQPLLISTILMNNEGFSLWQRVSDIYQKGNLKVRLLLIALTWLIFTLVVLFVTIITNRHLKSIRRNQIKNIKENYQVLLTEYLFDEESDQMDFPGMNKSGNRQVFIDELRNLHSNLHGETANKLRDLYFNMGLHKDSLKKVYHRRWDIKAKGFKELAQMDVKDANDHIAKYVNSKHPILRGEAQIAMVKLSEDNPLGFLAQLDYDLSYWEQINIYDTLIYHQINIDSFESWLESNNTSIVLFALRMIGLFKHVQSASRVKELLNDEMPEKRLAAVEALGALEISIYSEDLKILFVKETGRLKSIQDNAEKNGDMNGSEVLSLEDILPRKIRKAIIAALKPIASHEDIPFLQEIAQEYQNPYDLRILAINIILSIKPEGEQVLDQMFSHDIILDSMIINVKKYQES